MDRAGEAVQMDNGQSWQSTFRYGSVCKLYSFHGRVIIGMRCQILHEFP
jgi:hypothetical protein